MSVAALTPSHYRRKRAYEPSDSPEYGLHPRSSRRRLSPGDANSGACAALRALFPDMDEKVVLEVLAGCGNDVEEAVKQLGQLRLGMPGQGPKGAAPAPPPPAEQPAAAWAPQQAAAAPAGPHSAEAAGQQQQPGAAPQGGPGPGGRSVGEWAEALVEHLARAGDLGAARDAAAALLAAFEGSVRQQAGAEAGRAAELARDNAILKRAVAIQNARLQEVAAGKEAAVAELRGLLEQYQAKVQSLEMTNYSLAMHLRQAAGTAHPSVDPHFRGPPDVF